MFVCIAIYLSIAIYTCIDLWHGHAAHVPSTNITINYFKCQKEKKKSLINERRSMPVKRSWAAKKFSRVELAMQRMLSTYSEQLSELFA